MGIIPKPYPILMYNIKKFVHAISDKSHQIDGWMDKRMRPTYSKVQRGTTNQSTL